MSVLRLLQISFEIILVVFFFYKRALKMALDIISQSSLAIFNQISLWPSVFGGWSCYTQYIIKHAIATSFFKSSHINQQLCVREQHLIMAVNSRTCNISHRLPLLISCWHSILSPAVATLWHGSWTSMITWLDWIKKRFLHCCFFIQAMQDRFIGLIFLFIS